MRFSPHLRKVSPPLPKRLHPPPAHPSPLHIMTLTTFSLHLGTGLAFTADFGDSGYQPLQLQLASRKRDREGSPPSPPPSPPALETKPCNGTPAAPQCTHRLRGTRCLNLCSACYYTHCLERSQQGVGRDQDAHRSLVISSLPSLASCCWYKLLKKGKKSTVGERNVLPDQPQIAKDIGSRAGVYLPTRMFSFTRQKSTAALSRGLSKGSVGRGDAKFAWGGRKSPRTDPVSLSLPEAFCA